MAYNANIFGKIKSVKDMEFLLSLGNYPELEKLGAEEAFWHLEQAKRERRIWEMVEKLLLEVCPWLERADDGDVMDIVEVVERVVEKNRGVRLIIR